MSNHTNFIVQLVKSVKCSSYLELGVYVGETFSKVAPNVTKCIGVDIKDSRQQPVGDFFLKTTDEFFSMNTKNFDVIFIDADHRFESVKRDLEASLKVLNKRGIIILHDTDPDNRTLLSDGRCSNSYKINDYLSSRADLMFITLPIGTEGLTLVARYNDRKVLEFI